MIPRCDYFSIFKIQYYADLAILKKYGPSHDQHWERASLYNKLLWDFVTYCTGETEQDIRKKYVYQPLECALEKLAEEKGVFVIQGEGSSRIFVPKSLIEIQIWLNNNITLPFKYIQKTNMSGVRFRMKYPHMHRNSSLTLENKI